MHMLFLVLYIYEQRHACLSTITVPSEFVENKNSSNADAELMATSGQPLR